MSSGESQTGPTTIFPNTQKHSGKDLTYFDPDTNTLYIPYVIEPSLGADRVALAFLIEAYDEEVIDAEKNDTRVVLHLHPALAPFKAAVLLSPKSFRKAQKKFTLSFQDISAWTTTKAAR